MMLQRNEHDSAYSVSEIIQTCDVYTKSSSKVMLVKRHV